MSTEIPKSAITFAAILKQVAQELDLDIVYPDDPRRIYLTFPERNPGTKELQEKISQRIEELEEQA